MRSITLWRAAEDDSISDSASFAAERGCAEAYLDNPGFGGSTLYRADVEIDDSRVLDLYDLGEDRGLERLREITPHCPTGAIDVCEAVPRISYELRDAGYDWVRVRDNHPADCETWIFVGGLDAEPEMDCAE